MSWSVVRFIGSVVRIAPGGLLRIWFVLGRQLTHLSLDHLRAVPFQAFEILFESLDPFASACELFFIDANLSFKLPLECGTKLQSEVFVTGIQLQSSGQ